MDFNNQNKTSGGANSENILTVATYNINDGNREEQRKLLADENVDIFGIQQINYCNISFLDRGIAKFNPIIDFMKDPYIDSYFGKAVDFAGGVYGVAVISNIKMKDNSDVRLFMGCSSSEAVRKFIEVYRNFNPTKPETKDAMYNMKIKGIGGEMVLEPRVYTRSIIEKNGKEIAFYNTHLSYEDDYIRAMQMGQLNGAMKADPIEYKIAVGDFNIFDKNEMDIWKDDFRLANGKDDVWIDTFRIKYDNMHIYSIDNIIVSKNIEIKNVKAVQSDLSDHLPLIAVLELK